MGRFEQSFSGVRSIEYMAKALKAKQHIISQQAEYDDKTVYDRSKLTIGILDTGEPYHFNLRKSARIAIVAPPGSGKTILEQGFMSRFYKAGGLVAVPSDIKGVEYSSCSKPAQKEHWDKLFKFPIAQPVDEIPVGLPVKAYYPYFFSKIVQRDFTDQFFCQFKLQDLTVNDFLTIADVDDLSPLQRSAIEGIFDMIRRGEIVDFNGFEKYLLENDEIGKPTAKLLLAVARSMENQEVVGNMFGFPDFVGDLNKGKIPILNTYGAQLAGKKVNSEISAYVAIIIRTLYNAKAANKIPRGKHLLLVLDEMTRMCPNVGNPSSKSALLDMIRLSRSEMITMIMSFQYLVDVPDIMVDQATHIMFPARKMSPDVVRDIMQKFAPWEVDNAQTMLQSISLKMSQAPRWGWFCLDRARQETILFTPGWPLAFHRGEE